MEKGRWEVRVARTWGHPECGLWEKEIVLGALTLGRPYTGLGVEDGMRGRGAQSPVIQERDRGFGLLQAPDQQN